MLYLRYRENRQRGTVDFPFEFHHVTNRHPDYVMPLHWHTEFELIRVLKGALLLNLDNRDYPLREGYFAMIPSNLPHTAIPDDCEYECIVFDAKFMLGKNEAANQTITQLMEHTIVPQYVYTPEDRVITDSAWALFDSLASRSPGHQMIVMGSLFLIIGTMSAEHKYTLYNSNSDSEYSFRKSLRLQQALTFMENSFQKHLSLEDIANSVHMTPKSFCRFFREMAHQSPIEYLNGYRIDRACYQLLTTNMPITLIAYENGFNDLSYFIKTFRKYKGTTPKKYTRTVG